MPTIELYPTIFFNANTSTINVQNQNYALTNAYSNTCAVARSISSGTRNEYVYLRDFRTSSGMKLEEVPSGAAINSLQILLRIRATGQNTGTSYAPALCNGTSAYTDKKSNPASSSVQILSFPVLTSDFETFRNAGSNFGIRINCRRAASGTASATEIYGASIIVDYEYNPRTIESTIVEGYGQIDPDGTTTVSAGAEYNLYIYPTDKSNKVTVVNSDSEAVGSLTPYYDIQKKDAPINYTNDSYVYDPGGGIIVGYPAENPIDNVTGINVRAYSNSTTGEIRYFFDNFSLSPEAIILKLTVKAYGYRYYATKTSPTSVAQVGIYTPSGIISTVDFSSTTNSIVTTSKSFSKSDDLRAYMLSNHQIGVTFTVGTQYGGSIRGLTLEVTAIEDETVAQYYIYSTTVVNNAQIGVSFLPPFSIYINKSGIWREANKAYIKESGVWVEHPDVTTVFSTDNNYVCGD